MNTGRQGDGPAGRRRRRARSAEPERLKAAAFDAAQDAMVLAGEDREVMLLNAAAERLFGWPSDAARCLSVDALIGAQGADPGGDAPSIPRRRRVVARDRGGRVFPAEVEVIPVESGAQLFRIRDLSDEDAAGPLPGVARERPGAAEQAAASAALLGGIAHELNNPLAVVLAQATLLRDKAPDADVESRAAKIEAAARRAGRIVRDFLALAQHPTPVLAALDLDRTVDGALDRVAPGLREAGVALHRTRWPGLPAVQGDHDLLGQVLDHLLGDAQAVLQGRSGERRLSVGTGREGRRATIAIGFGGTGSGPARTGAGVGLSLCRSIVAAHDGDLALETAPDGEQRFVIGIPVAEAEPGRHRPAATALAILVVDDEIDVAQSLAELIEMFGHTVAVETSSDQALARVRQQRFDGVFTDLRMPGLDGLALRRAMVAEDPTLASRTAIVTGDSAALVLERPRLTVSPDILTLEKPFTAAAVQATLARMAAP